MKNKIKKSLIIILLIIIIFPLFSLLVCDIVYGGILDKRFETQSLLNFNNEEFEGLKRDKYLYQTNNNYNLCGYLYYNDNLNDNINGLIIVVHGLGSGHRIYMEAINYFVNNNFYVFAYDSSGTDESEGKVNGIPQILIDLKHTIDFIDTIDNINELPIFLFGHSLGGYAVCNVLGITNDVEAVVSVAGFNSSEDIILHYGKKYVSFVAYIGLPFVNLYENIKFKDYSKLSAIYAFENSSANVMIIHSEDDEVIPMEIGYDLYYSKFKDNPRFKFIKYKNRGHSYVIYSDDAISEIKKFNNQFNEWLNSLSYDYNKSENKERFDKEKEVFYNNNLDRNIIRNLIDKQLFEQIVNFYIHS